MATDSPPPYRPLPLEGMRATWTTPDGNDGETLSLRFENEAWTAEGVVSGADIQYVFRLTATWQLQQMLLFRDMDEPDLWLAHDGWSRWGEVNGSERRELGGCEDIDVLCSPFTRTMAVRRLSIGIGQSTDVDSITVDTETLSVQRSRLEYTRLGSHHWVIRRDDGGPSHEFDVDEFGLALDLDGHFRRVA